MTIFHFDHQFQIKILSLMYQDFDFLISTQDLVQPEYFSDEILVWYFLAMRDHYLDYQMRTSEDALRNELLKNVTNKKIKPADFLVYAKVFESLQEVVQDKGYIKDEVLKFCKHQAIKVATFKIPRLLQEEKFEEIESVMMESCRVGTDASSIGELYFINWPERLRRRAIQEGLQIIPTGISDLDVLIGGGIHGGQIGLWMGPTSRGKSAALGHCGKRAVIMRKRVIHYTFEMPQDEVCSRYDASFTKVNMHDLLDKEDVVAGKLEKYGVRMGNRLIVKGYSTKQASIQTIRNHIYQCCSFGFEPDLILIDYLDLVKPPRRYKERRDELTAVAEAMKGLALELKKPIWSATQAQRAAISMETHTEENVSEDIGKINTVDIAITMNQTRDEVRQKVMRLFLAKNRNGPKYLTVTIRMALERMCFLENVGPVFVNPPTSLVGSSKTSRKSRSRPIRVPYKTP